MIKDLLKRYLRINFFTFLVNFIFVAIFFSENNEQEGPIIFPLSYIIFVCCMLLKILPMLSITLLLNKAHSIRGNFYARLLSFFFLPTSYILIIYTQISLDEVGLYHYLMLPFYIIAGIEFWNFNKKIIRK